MGIRPTPALGRRFEPALRSETQAPLDTEAFVFLISTRAQPREARSAECAGRCFFNLSSPRALRSLREIRT